MDADKVSRSGRKVKIPGKFHDMEIVDPTTGRRTISNSSPLPPMAIKVKVPSTGKKRGRPTRAAMLAASHSHQNGFATDDLAPYPGEFLGRSEEDSTEISPSVSPIEDEFRNPLSAGEVTLDNLAPRAFQLQSTVSDGTPLNPGVSAQLRYLQPDGSALPLKKERLISPIKSGAVAGTINSQISQHKDPTHSRKNTLSPEDGGPAQKRRRYQPSNKQFEGHVDIPEGLLEAMREKRQITAYLVFCRSERPAVMREFPNGDFTQFSKELGSRWTALTEEMKEHWRHVAHRIDQTVTAERDDNGYAVPERSRKARDKLIRDLESRVNDVPSNSAFDLVTNMTIVAEQFSNMSNCVNLLSFTPGCQEPMGCLDALMDSALAIFSSTLGLMAQVPILRDYVDVEVFDELADNTGMIMPLIHNK